ncbi:hypothetical protein Daesc_009692 [Daldinia eschscholtzii]|uniref:Uncharacterized protein n=1 Tax=Daldinia eschscholtzii TaxID=292717 RepID=A0AAX6MAE2_9PEZI
MPFPKVSKTLPRWPDPMGSIGNEIVSSKLGRRKAWWPRGTALEQFENVIQPEIETILGSLDLSYADIFVKLYMIGRSSDRANPIIMICCTNRHTRSDAEETIRASDLLSRHPGFGLGAAALPLENFTPLRRLADSTDIQATKTSGNSQDVQYADEGTDISMSHDMEKKSWSNVLSPSSKPELGRRIYFQQLKHDCPMNYSTGGIVLGVEGVQFQLTASHLLRTDLILSPIWALDDSNDCHFDAPEDDENEEEDEESDNEYDLAVTSRGSVTPEELECQLRRRRKSSNISSPLDAIDEPEGGVEDASHLDNMVPWPRIHLEFAGVIPGYFHEVLFSSLDYALVELRDTTVSRFQDCINRLTWEGRTLHVQDIAQVGSEKCAVIVITSSRGPVKGVVIPGATSYRSGLNSRIGKIFQVQLEVSVVKGDSGSAIIDAKTGHFYGHLILGARGSFVAYFVPATEVFRDIFEITGNIASIFGGEAGDDEFASTQFNKDRIASVSRTAANTRGIKGATMFPSRVNIPDKYVDSSSTDSESSTDLQE